MLKKIMIFLFCFFALNTFAQENEEKWFFISIGLEGTYLKTTKSDFSYSPSIELQVKKFDHITFGIEGNYIGNKVLYDGAGQSEVIEMGEVIGKISFSFDSGLSFGFEGSKRFGDSKYDGLGGVFNFSLPVKNSLALEGSLSYDQNEYEFSTVKIKETAYDIDADLDFSLSDSFDWIIGANYNAMEYSPIASTYNQYSAYTKVFLFLSDSFSMNGGVSFGQDSAKYKILGAMGGFYSALTDNLSLNILFNYTFYTQELFTTKKSSGKKSPFGTSTSFSNYSLTADLTFTF